MSEGTCAEAHILRIHTHLDVSDVHDSLSLRPKNFGFSPSFASPFDWDLIGLTCMRVSTAARLSAPAGLICRWIMQRHRTQPRQRPMDTIPFHPNVLWDHRDWFWSRAVSVACTGSLASYEGSIFRDTALPVCARMKKSHINDMEAYVCISVSSGELSSCLPIDGWAPEQFWWL